MISRPVVIKYDLEEQPVTFDCAYYLANVAMLVRSAGFHSFAIWIKNRAFRNMSVRDQAMHVDEKQWRLENLIIPVCHRLIGCQSIVICEDRPFQNAIVFPDDVKNISIGYTAAATGELFKATDISPIQFNSSNWAKSKITSQFGGNGSKFVSLTIRQSRYFEHRNTDIEIIPELVEFFDKAGKKLIVIPDSEGSQNLDYALKNLDVKIALQASYSLDLRLALYQFCSINIGPSNGPVAMSFLTKNVNMLQFDQLKSDHTGQGVIKGWELTNGFAVGGNYPWIENGSRLCWDDLVSSNVIKHVKIYEDSVS